MKILNGFPFFVSNGTVELYKAILRLINKFFY